MKNTFFVISMLLTSVSFAQQYTPSGDIITPGNQEPVIINNYAGNFGPYYYTQPSGEPSNEQAYSLRDYSSKNTGIFLPENIEFVWNDSAKKEITRNPKLFYGYAKELMYKAQENIYLDTDDLDFVAKYVKEIRKLRK